MPGQVVNNGGNVLSGGAIQAGGIIVSTIISQVFSIS